MNKRSILVTCSFLVFGIGVLSFASGADWSRFRGPNGTGISPEEKAIPAVWAESNTKWKVPLPGPGHSCPIVVKDRIYLTCWTGYAVDRENPGDQKDLRLHLLSIDRSDGKTVWSKAIEPSLPEERYGGMFAQHGYASHTPVSDGEKIFAFFGKSGVVAFDLEGNQLWKVSVGSHRDERGWGSAASPIVYKNLVIVNASIEDNAIVALDKLTGKEVWKAEADGIRSIWGTPLLAKVDDDRTDLVLSVPEEIWGFNPDTGKLRWYCEGVPTNGIKASAILGDGVLFAQGDREGGALGVKVGGKGDIEDNIVWTENHRGGVSSPMYHDGLIYWISGGFANALDAKTGKEIYRERIAGGESGNAAGAGGDRGGRGGGAGRGGRGGGGFGRGGFGGGSDYASPVVSGKHLFQVTRSGDVIVLELGRVFKAPKRMKLGSPGERADFSATPAISNGEMFIRSTKHLYCIGE
jgi:outer membrane protein assembly factor BamB